MPAQITPRPTPRRALGGAEDGATILPFRQPQADDFDPATALRRVMQSLNATQANGLASEIAVLTAALSGDEGPQEPTRAPEGIRARHSSWCRSESGGDCDCEPKWEASVWSKTDKKKVRKTFPRQGEAVSWRRKHLGLADTGQLRSPARITFGETGRAWVEMAEAGEILTRSGKHYKPSTLRTIEQDVRIRLVPALGAHWMSDIARADFQRCISTWLAEGLGPSKIHGTITAAQVIFRDFDLIMGADNLLVADPTRGLRLPAVLLSRDRIATSDEARRLIAALDIRDQALWGAAMYAGVRHGELRALRVENIQLAMKRIAIKKGWDQYAGEIDPKTEKGKRPTVIIGLLEALIEDHLERTGRTGRDFVFGRTADTPFDTGTINKRARRSWKAARQREDEEGVIPEGERIRDIGLHECRHTAVSHMLDAGITIDKVSKFMGHASITVTIDRYGHLLPGGEAEAAALLDEYHERRRR
jgi:integrase